MREPCLPCATTDFQELCKSRMYNKFSDITYTTQHASRFRIRAKIYKTGLYILADPTPAASVSNYVNISGHNATNT